jgi:hypothetical protein
MSSSSSSSSSSEAVEGTDYHVEHFCTETDRCIPFNGIKTLYDSGTLQNGTKKPSDIVGIVNFFVRTTEPALLKYFPLEKGPDVRRFGGEYFDAYCRFRDTPEGTTEEVDVGPLYPIRTDGDGNCLLHAAALGAWGVHDRAGTKDVGMLRSMVFNLLNNEQFVRLLLPRMRAEQVSVMTKRPRSRAHPPPRPPVRPAQPCAASWARSSRRTKLSRTRTA